ncbi:MAG TPA: hypothetical protein DEB31_02000 [Clostridiales bacterium]|nr:hypothetical protein [Clostridiales bacterium]
MQTISCKKEFQQHGWVLVFFIALAILAYWQNFFTSETMGVYAGDTLRLGYAQREFIGQAVQSGQFPFWNPYNYSGVAFFAQNDGSLFYPPSWLFILFPGILAFKLSAALHIVLAGFGMYLFVWRLKKGRAAAVFAGIAYTLSATFLIRYGHPTIQNAMAMLPYVFFCFEGWFIKRKLRYVAYTAIAIAALFFSGFPQLFLYGMALFTLYVFFRGIFCRETAKSRLLVYGFTAASVAVAILVIAVQFLSTYEMQGLSVRSLSDGFIDYERFVADEGRMSELYVGILPLAVILLGFLAGRRERKSFHLLFFTAAAGLTLLFSMGDAIPLIPHMLYQLPLFGSMGVISRWTTITAFALCVAAGCAFPVIVKLCRKLPRPKLRVAVPFLVVAFLAVEVLVNSPQWLHNAYGSDPFPEPDAAVEYVKSNLKQGERFGLYQLYDTPMPNYYFFMPSLNATEQLPSINGYCSYAPAQYISVWNGSDYFDQTAVLNIPVMNMLSQRYVIAPANVQVGGSEVTSGMAVTAGVGVKIENLDMPNMTKFTIISSLGNSVVVPQGAVVANIHIVSLDGTEVTLPVRAGIDTAEMMYDHPDVLANIQHEQAPVAQQNPVGDGATSAFLYRAEFDLPAGIAPDTVEITYADGMGSTLQIWSLTGTSASGKVYPVQSKSRRADLELVFVNEETNIAVYENRNIMPSVYAPTNIVPAEEGEVATLMNAPEVSFDPRETAYIYSADAALTSGLPVGDGSVDYKYTSYRLNDLSIEVNLEHDQLVVVNESWYPGWTAKVDGAPVSIIPVNGILRGVVVPQGQHTITMEFMPTYFWPGVILSFIGAGICAILILRDKKWRVRRELKTTDSWKDGWKR